MMGHQYVARSTGRVCDERLFGDSLVRFLYSPVRERAPWMFEALTGARATSLLALLQFDLPLASSLIGNRRFLARCGVDLAECRDPPEALDTPRKIFERRLRYETCRPLPADPGVVVAPSDARVLVGSLADGAPLCLKDKFFSLDDLLGRGTAWGSRFKGADWAIFRLTPDRYHHNHCPVGGVVLDHYVVDGAHHACNPSAAVGVVTPCSANRREITIFDTGIPGGTGVGLVAMVEVVALMIGVIVQGYCTRGYDDPQPVRPGLPVERGQPKSLFRPGSSTVVLLLERGRTRFCEDLVRNQQRPDVASRYSEGFLRPLVETDVLVRSAVAHSSAPGRSHG